eukprot:jgi/Mesvir1/29771/Mv25439-RA.2
MAYRSVSSRCLTVIKRPNMVHSSFRQDYASVSELRHQSARKGTSGGATGSQQQHLGAKEGRRWFRPSACVQEVKGKLGESDIFDRRLKALQRDVAAKLLQSNDDLLTEVTSRVLDRIEDCKRQFPTVVNVQGPGEILGRALAGRGGIQRVIDVEMSEGMSRRKQAAMTPGAGQGHFTRYAPSAASPALQWEQRLGFEEALPVDPGCCDLVLSVLGLHWVNDLSGALAEFRRALKPDGLFLGALLGGSTLTEFRIACSLAEQEREGGLSVRMAPKVQVRDGGSLLTSAGFSLPLVDVDTITIAYPSALELVEHLRQMGEGNCMHARRPFLRRDTAVATAAIYQSMFGNPDGSVPATFQVRASLPWAPGKFDFLCYVGTS